MSDVITKVIIANEIKNGGIVVNAPFGADQWIAIILLIHIVLMVYQVIFQLLELLVLSMMLDLQAVISAQSKRLIQWRLIHLVES